MSMLRLCLHGQDAAGSGRAHPAHTTLAVHNARVSRKVVPCSCSALVIDNSDERRVCDHDGVCACVATLAGGRQQVLPGTEDLKSRIPSPEWCLQTIEK
eukprot:EC788384.1.p3 GENE.EC788384.1~~EC788384.1.p3  ORF type:complete len:99 (+),score=3.30 EC788384.1:221-517(+)